MNGNEKKNHKSYTGLKALKFVLKCHIIPFVGHYKPFLADLINQVILDLGCYVVSSNMILQIINSLS